MSIPSHVHDDSDPARILATASALLDDGFVFESLRVLSTLPPPITCPQRVHTLYRLLADPSQIPQPAWHTTALRYIATLERVFTMTTKAFIVHGWDIQLKLETKNYIQNTLHLEPIILHEQDGAGDVLINKFESYAHECAIAFVLLSSEDAATDAFADPAQPRRPRPNVLFELGYFFATLGRQHVLLLKKGDVEIHSDILGIEYIDVTAGVEAAGETIRKRLSWLPS